MTPSKREYQISELIAWGASDKEVAMELHISMLTARTHRRNIEHKIGAHNTADLTRWFFQEKQQISFGLNPRQVKHIAMLFFLLVTFSEFAMIPMVRLKASRVQKTETTTCRAKTRVRRNEYILA
jgi:DNA-binding CsgD family transcriptional regulator